MFCGHLLDATILEISEAVYSLMPSPGSIDLDMIGVPHTHWHAIFATVFWSLSCIFLWSNCSIGPHDIIPPANCSISS